MCDTLAHRDVSMADHVEARSLATLNLLAANPPLYPANPTEERHEPLTLYISRVPGTRGKLQRNVLVFVVFRSHRRRCHLVDLQAPEEERHPGGRGQLALLRPPGRARR